MVTDPLQLVAGTADAAFGTDEEGRIVIWNRAAERLLGHEAAEVLGKPCHEVLCGRDVFDNRFCDENCPLEGMAHRHEAIRHFEISLRKESGQFVSAGVSVLVVPGPRPSQFTLIHLVQPIPGSGALGAGTGRGALVQLGSPVAAEASPPLPASRSLTARETEVLRLLADGTGTQEIADSLFISTTTVRNHVQNILRKLEVHSKLEAVSFALHRRLI